MSTVTVVATVENSTGPQDPPRVRLNVTDTGTSPSLFAATVTRLDPDGRVVPVRTLDGNPLVLGTSGSNRVGLVYDYEMPYGAPVTYSTMETPGSSSAAVTVNEPNIWLVHPGVPELSMPVELRAGSLAEEEWGVQQGVFQPMGRRSPVIQTDGQRKSAQGTLELNTFTLDEAARFEALTDDAAPLLLNVPAGFGWGLPTSYIALGDLEEGRIVEYAPEPRRVHVLPYTVVDRPAGGSQSERTYTDVLAQFSSYTALRNAYSSYTALLAGP
jgi:hypothetical protein